MNLFDLRPRLFFPSKTNPCLKWTLTFCENSPGFYNFSGVIRVPLGSCCFGQSSWCQGVAYNYFTSTVKSKCGWLKKSAQTYSLILELHRMSKPSYHNLSCRHQGYTTQEERELDQRSQRSDCGCDTTRLAITAKRRTTNHTQKTTTGSRINQGKCQHPVWM